MIAVIFDMDGVIVDSERHWKALEGFFLQSLIPAWTGADQDRIIGLSLHDLYKLLAAEYNLAETQERFSDLYHEMAEEIYGQKASLIEGFPELLTHLSQHSVPLALSSSSPLPWIS